MATKSNYLIGGLAIAAVMIGALPAAQGIVSPRKKRRSRGQPQRQGRPAGRARTIAVKKAPAETAPTKSEPVREQTDKRRIMDGCDPLFSPVTVPRWRMSPGAASAEGSQLVWR